MGYDQCTVPDTVAVEPTFAASEIAGKKPALPAPSPVNEKKYWIE